MWLRQSKKVVDGIWKYIAERAEARKRYSNDDGEPPPARGDEQPDRQPARIPLTMKDL